jgi:hypothetical protein
MAGIKISNTLISKFPKKEQANLEQKLRQKSNGKCYLCNEQFNFASDEIELDHDIPVAENGIHEISNSNLVHASCNKWKRNNPSLKAQKFLPIKIFLDKKMDVNFSVLQCDFFKILPKEISIEIIKGGKLEIHLPNSTKIVSDIFEETINGNRVIKYIFFQVPFSALFNDNDVQPRNIKQNQVLRIFSDLHKNPIHEPIGLRLEKELKKGKNKLLMFDGQHKTVSAMLMGKGRIDAKLYLDLTNSEATYLVNSIQSKIPKLPLMKLELASKMEDEFKDMYEKYITESDKSGKVTSEYDFIENWVPADERNRAKDALIKARVAQITEYPAFEIMAIVDGTTSIKDKKYLITQQILQNKILKQFINAKPIKETNGEILRETERKNISLILNLYYKVTLGEYADKLNSLTQEQKSKIHNLLRQSSISLACDLMHEYLKWITTAGPNQNFLLEKTLSKKDLNKFEIALKRFTSHPIWTTSIQSSVTKEFNNINQKNQSLKDIARKISLTLAYIAGTEDLIGTELD